jgi:hypothetical protein
MEQRHPFHQTLVGFLLGALLGVGLNYAMMSLNNFVCRWAGCPQYAMTWCNALPLPILLGISLAYWVTHYPLAD